MRKFAFCKDYEGFATLPKRATKGSAGYDFYTTNEIPVEIKPHETVAFKTGIKAYMETDEVLMIHVRSSIGIKKGLVMANGTGIIDSDFADNDENEGNITIALYNTSDETQTIAPKERVAQGIFMRYLTAEDDNATEERTGGIGSTGE